MSSSSGCNYGEKLPPDVVFDILSRLPASALKRFRCVSKSWSSLISDLVFQQAQYTRAKQNPSIVITKYVGKEEDDQLVHLHFDKESRFLHPIMSACSIQKVFNCIDLICTYDNYAGDYDNYFCNIYVSDPSTKRSNTLPQDYTGDNDAEMLDQYVAFEYVASISEYKVLHISYSVIEDSLSCCYQVLKILTLGTCQWRRVRECEAATEDMAISNGAVYFLAVTSDEQNPCIAQFDLEDEDWSFIQLPNGIGFKMVTYVVRDRYQRYEMYRNEFFELFCLRQLGGLLALAHFSSSCIELWLLKDTKNHVWVKEYSIFGEIPRYTFVPLVIEQDGRMLIHTGNKLVYYDPKSRSFETIYAVEDEFTTGLYVDSLLSKKQFLMQGYSSVLTKKKSI